MSNFRGFLVAGAALAASTMAAQSDGLYGGRGSIKDGPVYAAPACPSWYVRIDGGYATFDRPALSQVGIDDLVWNRVQDTGSVGGGLGFYLTCNIRGDITVDHRFESDVTGFNANPFAPNYGRMSWGYSSTAILSNFYYDFNPGSRFSPYIGFGFGSVYNQFSKGKGVVAVGGPAPGNATYVNGNDTWHVAGAAMAGFVFSLHDRLKLDTGYRFLYLGSAITGQTGDAVIGNFGGRIHADNMHAHEFRIGLRYDIR